MRSAFRNAPPRTRFVGAHAGAGAERHGGSDADASGRMPTVGGSIQSRPRRAAMRSPVVILGAVIVALALGFGYVVIGSKRLIQPGPQIAAVEPPKPSPQPHPAPPIPASPAVVRSEPPTPAPRALPPSPPPPLPASSNPAPVIFQPSARPENAPTLLPWTPTAKQTSMPPSLPPPEPEPALAAIKPPPPEPKPDLLGTVWAVESASRIRVGERWIDLYGISDPTQRAHTQDMLAYLKPSRGLVECYHRTGGKYQCYADGKDLALLALQGGLARLSSEAPTEYRALSTPPARARH